MRCLRWAYSGLHGGWPVCRPGPGDRHAGRRGLARRRSAADRDQGDRRERAQRRPPHDPRSLHVSIVPAAPGRGVRWLGHLGHRWKWGRWAEAGSGGSAARACSLRPSSPGSPRSRARSLALVAILALGPPLGHALFRPVPPAEALWPPGWPESAGRPEPVELGRYLVAAARAAARGGRRARCSRGASRRLPAAADPAARAARASCWRRRSSRSRSSASTNVVFADRRLPRDLRRRHAAGRRRRSCSPRSLAMRRPGRRRAPRARSRARRRCAAHRRCARARGRPRLWLLEGLSSTALPRTAGVMAWTRQRRVRDPQRPHAARRLPPRSTRSCCRIRRRSRWRLRHHGARLQAADDRAEPARAARRLRDLPSRRRQLAARARAVRAVRRARATCGHTMSLPAMWPMRYGGAYLLAWLVARHVDGAGRDARGRCSRSAAVVTVDTTSSSGSPPLLACVVALLCARPPRSRAGCAALAGSSPPAACSRLALVALLTLARAGALPEPALLQEWPRIFTRPRLVLAADAGRRACTSRSTRRSPRRSRVAAVRVARAADDVLLTSMLAWSGVFGLFAGSLLRRALGRPEARLDVLGVGRSRSRC